MQWYCRILDEELGPMEFGDLVELAAEGTLARDDSVREGDGRWMQAGDVVGLFAAARVQKKKREAARVQPVQGDAVPTPVEKPLHRQLRWNRRWWIALGAVAVAAAGYWLWATRQPTFPEPRGYRPATAPAGEGGLSIPVFGKVSAFEFALLCFDACLVLGLLAWLGFRRGCWWR